MSEREPQRQLDGGGTGRPPAGGAGQGELFDGSDIGLPPPLEDGAGYRGPIAMKAAGITYRQLDYWARTDLVAPSVRSAAGSGSQRLYSFHDILILRLVKKLQDSGISLQNVRSAIEVLRTRGVHDLTSMTLMSDGATIYECTSQDEVIDLLAGGQGVFGIAVGPVAREVEGQLAELPCERPDQEAQEPLAGDDELSRRRRTRRTTA